MKKFLLSFFVIAAFIAYALHQRNEDAQAVLAVHRTEPTPTEMATPTTASAGGSPTPTTANQIPTATPIPQGKYKNGTYTGDSVDAFYGLVQVQVVVQNGKITDVSFLQYPSDRQTSREISSQAMPYLKQEAIQAQSANVDIVSGATQTSEAFRQSLQSALDKAV